MEGAHQKSCAIIASTGAISGLMESYCPQFVLKQARAIQEIKRSLRERGYQFGRAHTITGRREIYDTFDWRLFKNRLLLGFDPDNNAALFLFNITDAVWTSQGNTPAVGRFLHEIESAAIASRLAPVIEARALIRRGSFALQKERRDISNKHGKIIARLHLEQLTGPAQDDKNTGAPLRVVRLQALRGYERKTKKLFSWMTACCNGTGSADGLLSTYFTALGRTPGDYSSKLLVQLDRGMTIRQAMSAILLSQLDMMERNTPGIRDDIDTEFLHDFRIANRRSRSLISGMRHVLPAPQQASGKQFFSWLSKQTSTLRDIDVFLLAFRQYKQLLPVKMYTQLLPLQTYLQESREKERIGLLGALDSDRYRGFIRSWRASLLENATDENGTGPVLKAADESVWNAWKRVRKQGRHAARTGTDEALHELRIAGKKLRYLLEAFRTLFPAKDVEQAIRQLRKLQNVLGDIVDYQVQQQYLSQWQENFPGKRHRGVKAAMDYLGKVYARRENATKKEFQRHYDAFVSVENRELFKTLCGKTSA